MLQMHLKFSLVLLLTALTWGCGGGQSDNDASANEADFEARKSAMLAAMQQHFDTKMSLPPAVQEALERGEIGADEIAARSAAGEFEPFFRFKTAADLPADLEWEDGSDLPDLGSPAATKGGTLYGALSDFPRTLRLYGPDANGSFRPWILDDMRMQLGNRHPNDTSIDAKGNFRYFPGVAAAWAADMDNATVYVRLNPAARFSDGTPITADDMMFTFYLLQSPHIRAPWYNNNFQRSYSHITRYDKHTFSLTLPEAKPNIYSRTLELTILPTHFFYEYGEDYVDRYQWRFVPTTGPFVIAPEDIKKGRSITLTRNPDWWAKDNKFWRNRFNADRIQLTVIRDSAKAFEAFKKGELSMANLTLPEYFYEKLPVSDPLVTDGYVDRAVFYNDVPRPTYGLWINTGRPLLNDRDVRMGINYAINYRKVIDEFFRGDYARMRTTADGYGDFSHPTLQARPFDVEQALAHFAKAGFKQRGSDGVLVNAAGERLSFTVTTGYETLQGTLTILREEALKAGLELRLEILDGTASWKKVQEKQHDIAFVGFNVSPEMYPRYWETFHSVNAYDIPWLADGTPNPERQLKPQTNNLLSLANPQIDRLIEAYRASDDVAAMQQLAFQLEELLYEEAAFIPGFVIPFMRTAYWRWLQWPEDFNVKLARSANQYHLAWINQEVEAATRAARRTGATFPVVDRVYDQYREPTQGDAPTP